MVHRGGRRTAKGGKLEEDMKREENKEIWESRKNEGRLEGEEEEVSSHSSVTFRK